MNKQEIITIIISAGISTFFSVIASIIVLKIELNKKREKEIWDNYYVRFHNIWDKIHQGCAYNFSDLDIDQQEEIIEFLIETDRYQDNKIRELVYELKTSRLNNFDSYSEVNITTCNNTYNAIVKEIINNYSKKIRS